MLRERRGMRERGRERGKGRDRGAEPQPRKQSHLTQFVAASLPVPPSLSVHQLLRRSLAVKAFPSFDPKGVSRHVTELATACPLNPAHRDFEIIRSLFSRVSICGRINELISGGQVRVGVFSSFPVSLQLSPVKVAAEFASSYLNAIDMR